MDDLRATFAARWQALGMDATVAAPDETLRPDAATTDQGSADSAPLPDLPRITFVRPASSPSATPPLDLRADPSSGVAAPAGDLIVTGTLGEGGMGRVLLARQRSLRRDVAVKTVKPGSPRRALGALLAEGALTGSLEHPGIVPVHLLGIDEQGRPALVMKRIEGVSWAELVDDAAHPAWSEVAAGEDALLAHLRILGQVANALHFAHSRGVVHRDVKPENVMLGRYGEVYLVDWGVAGALGEADGELCGTPGFMAPEQVTGGALTAATDVYLLGATLHNALTGQLLHGAPTLHACLEQAFLSEPVTHGQGVPEELAALIRRATARDPAARPATALEFRQALDDYLRHRSSRALAATAEARLAVVEAVDGPAAALAGLGKADAAAPLARLGELLAAAAEAHFGFQQALREWPGNAPARAGLERTRRAQVELELRQGNAHGARAHLATLAEPDPTLAARVAQLERRQAEAAERSRMLDEIEHQRDARVGSRQRTLALVGLAACAATASIWVTSAGGTQALTPARMVVVSVVITGTTAVMVVVLRRQLLGTAYNRGAVGLLLVLMAGMLAGRLLGWHRGTPPADTLTRELWLLAVGAGAGAVLHSRAFAYPMAVYAAAFGLAVARPEHAIQAFSTATIIGIFVLLLAWRTPPDPRHGDAPPS